MVKTSQERIQQVNSDGKKDISSDCINYELSSLSICKKTAIGVARKRTRSS
jgi:hypothetical protein